jgi:hypothetical protein
MGASGLKRSTHVPTRVSAVSTPSAGHIYSPFTTGSNVIVAGTAIFNAQDPEKVIATLKASVETAQAKGYN